MGHSLFPHAISFVLLVNILLYFIEREQRIGFLTMVRLGTRQARIIALVRLRSRQAIGTVAFKRVSYHTIPFLWYVVINFISLKIKKFAMQVIKCLRIRLGLLMSVSKVITIEKLNLNLNILLFSKRNDINEV